MTKSLLLGGFISSSLAFLKLSMVLVGLIVPTVSTADSIYSASSSDKTLASLDIAASLVVPKFARKAGGKLLSGRTKSKVGQNESGKDPGGSSQHTTKGNDRNTSKQTKDNDPLRFDTDAEAGVPVNRPVKVAKRGVQANKAAGDAFETQIKGQLQRTDTGVVQQVTIKTQSGVRTRVDLLSRDSAGAIRCTECKASATAPLTKNQRLAFPEIQQSGGVVVGKGKPGFPGDTQIPPTKVDIVRP